MGFFFNRKSKPNPVSPIDPGVAEQWVKVFADKPNTDEVLIEKAIAIVPVLKQETRDVAIGIASSDANQKIAEIAYELLYFYMHLCYLTVFKTLGDEKATLFVYTAVSTIIRQRYRGEEIEMLPQFMQYVLNSKGIDLLTQYEINHRQPGMFEIKLR